MARSSQNFYKGKGGFALLVTIVLVAFLVLILIGLATFTRVETQVAGNSGAVAKARQNALTGLNLAVGKLQQFAGPDGVVTARSDITNTAAPRQSFLTGAWTVGGGANPAAWLVSDATLDPSTGLDPAVGTALFDDTGTGEVFLVANNSIDPAVPAQRVRLRKESLSAPAGSIPGLPTSEIIGNYAYWVGDEGTKASLRLPIQAPVAVTYNNTPANPASDPPGDDFSGASNTKRARLSHLSLSRPGYERLFPGFLPDDPAIVPELRRLTQPNQLPFFSVSGSPPSGAVVRANFHDVTPLSRGVLADTTTNRLRVDWSARSTAATATGAFLKARPSAVTNYVADYIPSVVVPAAPIPGTWPVQAVSPILTEVGVRFYFTVSGGNIVINYHLVAELWNPYAARLVASSGPPLRVRVIIPSTTVDFTDGVGTVSLALPTTYDATVDTTVAWAAGEVHLLRGGSSLVTGGTFAFGTQNVGAAGAITDVTEYTIPAVAGFNAILDNGASVEWQNYTLPATYTTTNETITNNSASVAANAGLGYELSRNFLLWTDGSLADSRDLRLPAQTGTAFYEPIGSGQWAATPSSNATAGLGLGDFRDTRLIVIHDLPRQEVTNLADFRHAIGDKPYMLGNRWGGAVNTNLDAAFVSAIPRNFNWPIDGTGARANPYLELFLPQAGPAVTLASLRDENESARYQMIKGAFNINSTSVSAWEAVLGTTLTDWIYNPTDVENLANAFFRTPHGAQQLTALDTGVAPLPDSTEIGGDPTLPILRAGGRQLTDPEVTTLAAEIVRRLKVRGRPFESLAAFADSGLVADAINTAGLNTVIGSTELRHTASALTQADVIAAITPFIAARSDTFLVRAYGDVRNPVTGIIEARTWCEAVVQRVPDLVSDPAAAIADVVTPPNLLTTNKFGRAFRIISFRWLSPADI